MATKTKDRTPEEQKAIDDRLAKAREAKARKQAEREVRRVIDEGGPAISEEHSLGGNPAAANPLRSVKIVKPACQVATMVMGKVEYTTGPCQEWAARTPGGALEWFKRCTHGPEVDAKGKPIPPELRPYYEGQVQTEQRPVVGEGGVIEGEENVRRWIVRIRLGEAVADKVAMSGRAPQYWAERGARDPAEFGLGPFCSYYRCWRTDVRDFKNGTFCSEIHAKLVKAHETGVVIPLGGFDNAWPDAVSSRKRQEVLRAIDV